MPPSPNTPPVTTTIVTDGRADGQVGAEKAHRTAEFQPPFDHALSVSGLWYPRDVGPGFGARLAYQYIFLWPAAVRLADSLQDDLALEVDLSYSHHRFQPAKDAPRFTQRRWSANLSALWNVWFTSQFGLYAKFGLGYRLGAVQPEGVYSAGALTGLQGTLGLGACYRIRAVALRLEVSSRALGLGLAYALPL